MPRASTIYEEAVQQGRLWTPRAMQGSLYHWSDPIDWSFTAGASSTQVSRIADKTNRGLAHYQATAGKQPYLAPRGINGRQALQYYQGLISRMDSENEVSLGSATSFICAIVAQFSASSPSYARLFTLFNTGFSDYNTLAFCIPIVRYAGNAALSTYWNSNDRATTSITYDVPFIFVVTYDGTNIQQYLNGAAGGTGTMSLTMSALTRFSTGGGDASYNASPDGFVGETLFATGIWPDAIRRKVEGRLAWRYGLQNTLVAGHEYRNAPPLIGA